MLSQSVENNTGGRRRNVGFVALAIAFGGIAWIGLQQYQSSNSIESKPTETMIQLQIKTVTALGQLQPKGETIQLSAPMSGGGGGGGSARIDELRVREGDSVKPGQVVAVLDSRDRLQAAVNEAKSQINIAQAKLAQVKAGSQQGTINAQSAELGRIQADLQGNEIEQREAIARLEAQFAGDLASQRANLQRLKATYQNAKLEAQRYDNLHREGAVSDSQRDSKALIDQSTGQQVKEAEAVIDRTKATAERQIKEAKARLVKIQAAGQQQVEQAEATLDRVSEVRPVDVFAAQAEVDRAEAALNQAEVSLADAYVRSPQAGVILDVFARPGEVVGNDGIVEIGKTQQMYAIAEIYQSDIAKIQPGMKATVTSDSLAKELQGTVERIDAKIQRQNVVSSDPTENIDSRVVEAHIRLNGVSSQQVKNYTNLQVKVVIQQ